MSNESDFIINHGMIIRYVGPGGDVVIPDNVTSIAKSAFRDCISLTAITIPNNITAIRYQAFYNCCNLSSVTIPNGIWSIGHETFYNCCKIASVTIPNGVKSIGYEAFSHCTGLTRITIPDSVTSIEDSVFYGCESLTSVTIPDSVTSIGDGVFRGCTSLASVTLPNNVKSIGHRAFCGCENLTSVTIPDSVTSIGDSAFRGCKNLTSVTIPDSVTSIGVSAFCGCENLTSVTIPDSVTSIGDRAFEYCKRVTLPTSVGSLFAKQFYISTDLCIDILDISALPAKFRIYAALCFAKDGGDATDPRYENHIKYLKTNAGKIIDDAVQNLPLLTLLCRENCIKAKDIEAYTDAVQRTGDAEKITLILDYQNNKLTLKEKERAAKKKERQENAAFERAVFRINQGEIAGLNFVVSGALDTFENHNTIKAFIESKGGKLQSSVSAKTDYLITNDPSYSSEKKDKANSLGIEIITEAQFNDRAGRAFYIDDGVLMKYRGAGGSITIPDSVTSIGILAFSFCKNLTSVTIPDSVTSIDNYAFTVCTKLSSITIPDSVTSIGNDAFDGCPSIVIYAPAGSYTETYAKENNIPFVAE